MTIRALQQFAAIVCLLAIGSVLLPGAIPTAAQSVGHPPHTGATLTAQGRLLYNFESLLRRTFGRAQVCAKTYHAQKAEWNFTAGQCSPLAIYSLYFYTFAHPRGSVDRIAGYPPKHISFGNYPLPVLIRGHLVSCAARGHRDLISYVSGVGLAFGCRAP